jgi:hypothetical protein
MNGVSTCPHIPIDILNHSHGRAVTNAEPALQHSAVAAWPTPAVRQETTRSDVSGPDADSHEGRRIASNVRVSKDRARHTNSFKTRTHSHCASTRRDALVSLPKDVEQLLHGSIVAHECERAAP